MKDEDVLYMRYKYLAALIFAESVGYEGLILDSSLLALNGLYLDNILIHVTENIKVHWRTV